MESSQWENWNHLFCRKVSFLTAPHCQFRGVGQGIKQTYLYLTVNFEVYVQVWSRPICICGILYFKLNGIDAVNEMTKPRNIQWKDIIYIVEREIKGSG